ncbi:MAG: thermonuclease family protein [Bryobacteraceae bacterium]|nr:thermonuclease family protein [Bryobacteraceae bacterium]
MNRLLVCRQSSGFAAVVFCLPFATLPLFAQPDWNGKVVNVVDGDTFDILKGDSVVRVRLYGTDAPESGQAFGAEATAHANDLAFGKVVRVEPISTDSYGRTVAEVVLPDERSLNQELIRAGLARWYQRYAPDDRKLQELEAEARQERRGLWADPAPEAPWDWRKNFHQASSNPKTTRRTKNSHHRGSRTAAERKRSERRSER